MQCVYSGGKKEWPRSFELISAPNHFKQNFGMTSSEFEGGMHSLNDTISGSMFRDKINCHF
jgi:hypothetical protein